MNSRTEVDYTVSKFTRAELITAAVIALVTLCLYLPALQNGFTNWDDDGYVTNNPSIRSFDAPMITWAFTQFYEANWHPLTWISHSLDVALWGMNPAGHHLTSIVLHAANTFLVILLILHLLHIAESRRPYFHDNRALLIAAAAAGILFGIHPLHVESVAWIAERKDLLCALFFLLSLLAYAKYAESSRDDHSLFRKFGSKPYVLALSLFALAVMSKPMAVTLPVILLVLDWFPFGRLNDSKTLKTAAAEKVPFFLISLASAVLTVLAQRSEGTIMSMGKLPLLPRLFVSMKVLMLYLWKMALPLDLVPFYPYPKDVSLLTFDYLLSIALVLGITAAAAAAARKQKLWLALWAYYGITLLPVLGIVQVGSQEMADRYTYLPSIGPFLLAGLGASWLYGKTRASKSAVIGLSTAAGIAAILLAYGTIAQIGIWKDSLALWNYAIAKTPGSSTVYIQRGLFYGVAGDYEKALADFRSAVAADPKDARARHNLGTTYDRLGMYREAFEEYSISIELQPGNPEATGNRAVLFLRAGDIRSAMIDFQQSCAGGKASSCRKLRDLLSRQER